MSFYGCLGRRFWYGGQGYCGDAAAEKCVSIKYVDDVDIINQYEDVKGKLEAVKASRYDIEKDLQRGAVPENKIKAAKSKNNKYKGFIKKYEKKINEMKNNQKLVDEFLEDYNKITEK